MKSDLAKIFETGIYAITPDTDDLSLLVRQVEAAIKGGCVCFSIAIKLAHQVKRLALLNDLNK
jgi:thiamine monophosphate synthase